MTNYLEFLRAKMPKVCVANGDCLDVLRQLPDGCIDCCVTSPPYWGLRDYGVSGQIGLEPTPDEYVAKMVEVFREVRRVLRDDATLWMNLGDSYNAYNGGAGPSSSISQGAQTKERPQLESGYGLRNKNLKPKDLIGIPWRVAFALQADGWYLRSDIIWSKPNPMPESVTDRPTKAHEYIFLLSKSQRYFYDAEAIKEESVTNDPRRPYGSEGAWQLDGRPKEQRPNGQPRSWKNSRFDIGKTGEHQLNRDQPNVKRGGFNGKTNALPGREAFRQFTEVRNKRSVWTVPTQSYKEAHFATFPPDLIKPCILAGCRVGGIVLDPFGGSGTTGEVAVEFGRRAFLIELNPAYIPLIEQRTNVTPGLPLEAA
jgi:DNA modification methylase